MVVLDWLWTKQTETGLYLDPGEEDDDSSHVVELDLQVGQRLKARVSGVVLQQAFQTAPNHRCSGDVHDNGYNTQLKEEQTQWNLSKKTINVLEIFDTHHDDENIQTVPQALEVMQTVDVDLQHLLHHVVQDEQAERHLTQTHKVIPAGHVSYQTHCLELPGGHHATSSRELHQQPDKCTKSDQLLVIKPRISLIIGKI